MEVTAGKAIVYLEMVQPWPWLKLNLLPQNLIAWR